MRQPLLLQAEHEKDNPESTTSNAGISTADQRYEKLKIFHQPTYIESYLPIVVNVYFVINNVKPT